MSFQRPTITSDEEPMPITARPGAASAKDETQLARVPGPRVYAGMMAVPTRAAGAQRAARISGVKPSAPPDSADQKSVYPRSASSLIQSSCSSRGTPSNGTVIP